MAPLKPRLNQLLSLGNEGAGIVIDAGYQAKGMVGKTVGLAGGGMYCQYRCMPANNCLIMDDQTTPEEAASSFVNPMTALGFIETMKLEGHQALVHTAASSNLGQMLIKICKTVFLGGSIIKHGGQNPLEAARYGCKILHGPNVWNFDEIYKLLKKH